MGLIVLLKDLDKRVRDDIPHGAYLFGRRTLIPENTDYGVTEPVDLYFHMIPNVSPKSVVDLAPRMAEAGHADMFAPVLFDKAEGPDSFRRAQALYEQVEPNTHIGVWYDEREHPVLYRVDHAHPDKPLTESHYAAAWERELVNHEGADPDLKEKLQASRKELERWFG